MANTKKTVDAPAEVKEAAEVKTEAAAETAAPKKETAKKPAAKKSTAKAAEKKPAAKRGRKPAAAKTEKEPAKAAKKPAAKTEKPAAKPGRKPAAKAAPAAEAAPAKKGRKKGISYEDIVKAAEKKFLAADVTKIKYPIAANIELNGTVNGDFYVYINADTKEITVAPYKYDDRDVGFRADADELMAVLKGKKNIYDALANGLIKVDGITKKAVLLINAAF